MPYKGQTKTEYMRKYRQEHREEIKIYRQQRYKEHKSPQES